MQFCIFGYLRWLANRFVLPVFRRDLVPEVIDDIKDVFVCGLNPISCKFLTGVTVISFYLLQTRPQIQPYSYVCMYVYISVVTKSSSPQPIDIFDRHLTYQSETGTWGDDQRWYRRCWSLGPRWLELGWRQEESSGSETMVESFARDTVTGSVTGNSWKDIGKRRPRREGWRWVSANVTVRGHVVANDLKEIPDSWSRGCGTYEWNCCMFVSK